MKSFIILFEDDNAALDRFDLYIRLIEVLIWPLTVIIIILLFRRQFKNAMKRMGSFEASATGLSMTFNEVVNEGRELAQKVKPLLLSKSGVKVNDHEHRHHEGATPYEQLAGIDHELKLTLQNLAKERGIDTGGLNTNELADELEKIGEFSYNHTRLVKKINQLISISNKNITQTQVNDIKNLKESLIK